MYLVFKQGCPNKRLILNIMKNPSVLFWIIVINLWPACSSFLFSQQVLNGSFEVNTLDCGINLGNAEFNSHVMNISAFGGQSEIDLLSASCGYEIPPDGDFFIALYNNTFSDACSFELTSPLNAGKLYKLRFAARLGDGFANQISKVEIGLSNFNDSFGTSVFFSPELESNWQYYEVQFSPVATFQFISIRIVSSNETWVFTDDFSLECPTIDLGNDTSLCVVENIILKAGPFFETYQWSDFSSGTSIVVDEPGKYWVEVKDGNCIIRDTIVIEEIPFNCGCKIYVPNIFSPNNDGINDEFHPLSPCELLDYQLTVFDRWGRMAYRSNDAAEGWDGSLKGRPVERGVFVYILQYRFFYQTGVNLSYGSISIIR